MAEIKSTMDLVMERAARIGKASTEELRKEEARKKGVLLTVDYMEGKTENLLNELQGHDKDVQVDVLQGMAETILRNIFLPRDEIQQERTAKAVDGLKTLDNGGGIGAICTEITNILGGYLQHREQLRGQLEEQIKKHYENLMAQQQGMQPDPNQQPKFQEEWNRVETELNSQYGNALEQLKLQINQRLGMA